MIKARLEDKRFEIIEGGKENIPITKVDPKGPEVLDWLRGLGHGARFLTRGRHNRGCFLDNYGIAQVLDNAVMLYNFLPQYGASPYVWVDSFKFSQDHVLVEILPSAEGTENPTEEEGNNEQDYLSLPEPRQNDDGHEGPA